MVGSDSNRTYDLAQSRCFSFWPLWPLPTTHLLPTTRERDQRSSRVRWPCNIRAFVCRPQHSSKPPKMVVLRLPQAGSRRRKRSRHATPVKHDERRHAGKRRPRAGLIGSGRVRGRCGARDGVCGARGGPGRSEAPLLGLRPRTSREASTPPGLGGGNEPAARQR